MAAKSWEAGLPSLAAFSRLGKASSGRFASNKIMPRNSSASPAGVLASNAFTPVFVVVTVASAGMSLSGFSLGSSSVGGTIGFLISSMNTSFLEMAAILA